MDCSMPGLSVHHQLPEFTQAHVHWVSDAIQSSHLLLSPSPPDFNLSQHQGLFQWVSSLSFSFSISPSSEYSGLISFRMDWLDLLAVQGTLKSLLQHQSSKASILWRSAFFLVQLSHPYMTTGKTLAFQYRILYMSWVTFLLPLSRFLLCLLTCSSLTIICLMWVSSGFSSWSLLSFLYFYIHFSLIFG